MAGFDYQNQSHQYYREPLELMGEIEYLIESLHPQEPTTSRLVDTTHSTYASTNVITYVKNTRPVIQHGPMCGIVALTMALDTIRSKSSSNPGPQTLGTGSSSVLPSEIQLDTSHPQRILEFAKEAGFTKKGEMFSAEYMRSIAEHYLRVNAKIVNFESLHTASLLELLVSKPDAVLVPYDADKDHAPCQAKGHKAHWCVLVGFALTVKVSSTQESQHSQNVCSSIKDSCLLQNCSIGPRVQGHLLLEEKSKHTFVSTLTSIVSRDTLCQGGERSDSQLEVASLHVFARHGKSRHLALWSIEELRKSNSNLLEIDPQRVQCGAGEYVIPEPGGIEDGLCGKALIFSGNANIS